MVLQVFVQRLAFVKVKDKGKKERGTVLTGCEKCSELKGLNCNL